LAFLVLADGDLIDGHLSAMLESSEVNLDGVDHTLHVLLDLFEGSHDEWIGSNQHPPHTIINIYKNTQA